MEIRVTFCIAQKVTMVRPTFLIQVLQLTNQSLVAQKTRQFSSSIAWFPYLLARLFPFHLLFLEVDFTHASCHCLKQIFLAARTVLSDSQVPIRNDLIPATQTILGHSLLTIQGHFIDIINITSRTCRSSSERKVMPPRGLLAGG